MYINVLLYEMHVCNDDFVFIRRGEGGDGWTSESERASYRGREQESAIHC